MTKKPFYEAIAEKIIDQLQAGTAPWLIPWSPGNPNSLMPFNPISDKRYRGINAIQLLSEKYEDLRWMTYKQALTLGGQVKKGEKGTVVQYWKFNEEKLKRDENKNPILDTQGNTIREVIKLERPKVFYATVFNAEQIDGIAPYVKQQPDLKWEPIERAEKILLSSGATIKHNESDRAYYKPMTDTIHLPSKAQFHHASDYYATALHELGHWTGHASRLDRDMLHPFGSEHYAREELRAEISSMILGDELGIGHNPSQHAAYIKSWIKILKDDPLEIFRAAADAEKIHTYIMSYELTQTHEVAVGLEKKSAKIIKESKDDMKIEPVWLNIPFNQKDTVKQIAGLLPNGKSAIAWNKESAQWYAKPGADLEKLKPWLVTQDEHLAMKNVVEEITWLAVPYNEKETFKQLTGKLTDGRNAVAWDKQKKCWFAHPGADLDKLKPWLITKENIRQEPALSPKEEFASVLQSLGCEISGEHPIMDGKKHRIRIDSDKGNEKSGFYVAYLDDHPAGFAINNRTGVEQKWKSKGYHLTDEEKATMHSQTVIKQQERAAQQLLEHENVAQKVLVKVGKLLPIRVLWKNPQKCSF